MTQYILLIHDNVISDTTEEEWQRFFTAAQESGLFKGGSEIGKKELIGNTQPATASEHLGGYMRFDATDKAAILELLKLHPVVMHGGTVELCEMPKS